MARKDNFNRSYPNKLTYTSSDGGVFLLNNFFKLNYELAVNEVLFNDNLISIEQYKQTRDMIRKKLASSNGGYEFL